MTLPVSDLFDVADWNPRAKSSADGSAFVSDSTKGVLLNVDKRGSVDVVSGNLLVGASASAITAVSVAKLRGVAVGEVYTIEVSLRFPTVASTRLIPGANHGNSFFRIRAAAAGYPELNFYFTSEGIFVAGSEARGKTLVGGSAAFVADDSIVRIVVDNATSSVSVFAGAPDAYRQGEGPWYNYPNVEKLGAVRIPAVWETAKDEGIFLEAAASATDVLAVVTSLRIASSRVLVSSKPVAAITAKEVCVAGSILSLYSGNSEDAGYSYVWNVENKPAGAAPLFTGHAYAGFELMSESGGVRLRATEPTSAMNGWRVIAQRGRANSELSISINAAQRRLVIKFATDAAGAVLTTPKLLGYAFSNPADDAYSQDISDLFTVDILASNIDEPLETGSGLLAGGAASTDRNTSALLDVPGAYVISLRIVQNGIWSDPAIHTVFVQLSDQLVGGIPNSELFLSYINDFWKTVDDLDQIKAVWTAATRLLGASVSELWQQDMAKSLPELPERFSRKWLTYKNSQVVGSSLLYTEPAEVLASVQFGGPGFRTVRQVSVPTAEFSVGDVLLACTAVGVPTIHTVDSVDDDTVSVTGGIAVAHALGSYSARYVSTTTVLVPADLDLQVPGELHAEFYAAGVWSAVAISAYNSRTRILTVVGEVPAPEPDGYLALTIVAHSPTVRLLRCSVFSAVVAAEIGDIAVIRVDDSTTGIDVECTATVLATNDDTVIVDLAELQRSFFTASEIAGEGLQLDLAVAQIYLLSVRSARVLGSGVDLLSVPYLGSTAKHDLLVENDDYIIRDGTILANDLAAGVLSVQDSAVAFLSTGAAGFSGDYADVLLSSGLYPGLYSGTLLRGGRVRIGSGQVSGFVYGRVPRFTAARVPAEEYAAELSYFSNDETLWRNFGVLVGHSRERHAELGIASSYSGTVRGMWSAFIHGPNIAALQSAVQIMVGLPYTTRAGHIIEITESTDPAQDGYILLLVGQELLTFRLPYGMRLAINPNTGRTVRASDPAGARDDVWEDAEVPAFFSFVDVVTISDAVVGAEIVEHASAALDILRSRHTFVVRIPLNSVSLGDIAVLIKDFLREARPAYTNFIILGVLSASDSVTVADSVQTTVTVFKQDTLYFPAFRGELADDSAGRASVESVSSSTYPVAATLERYSEQNWSATDAVERFSAGYAVGVLNDYAGDGSWNAAHSITDTANRITTEIDVTASRMWVPVVIGSVTPDLQVGEFVTVTTHSSSSLNLSRPYIEAIGCGEHPKIPFGVQSPQKAHPYTYLILAFDGYDPDTGRCDGIEERLDALSQLDGMIVLEGATSGGQALVLLAPSRTDNPEHFMLEYVLRSDVATDMCPRDTVRATLTTYISLAGITYGDLRAVGSFFDNSEPAQMLQRTAPYELAPEGVAPCPARSLLTALDDKSDGDLVVYDFADSEDVLAYGEYVSAAGQSPLANTHIGYGRSSRVLRCPPHGLNVPAILTPAILTAELDGYTLRVDGAGFLDADPSTSTTPPSQEAYDGEVGITWLYLEDGGTSYPVTQVNFEVGTGAGRFVHGHDGAAISSTGNILVANIPVGIPAGVYDLRVANIRPYVVDGETLTAVTSFVMERALDLTSYANPFVNDDGAGLSSAGVDIAGG